MRDPIGSFDTIKENFIKYVKTAFKTKFESLEIERESLLNEDKVLYRQPWIEPLPEYASSQKTVENLTSEDLPGLNETERALFKELVGMGLIKGFELHKHQLQMLKKALSGKNCIITSGTGSGKTESFLLPLFAQLSKDLSNWSPVQPKGDHVDDWWNKALKKNEIVDAENNFHLHRNVSQRVHETRPQGMRALIIYPMNALVEDQMTRLRIALDSDPIREWLRTKGGNQITFGRYNGSTPISGKLEGLNKDGVPEISTTKIKTLQKELKDIERNQLKVDEFIEQEKAQGRKVDEVELKSFFQRLDGSEMRSRFDMQLSPPDILITNFSMLSIMLMREIDSPVFNKTRDWLDCIDLPLDQREKEKENRVFNLIIDELHLYRGTQGTEIALLLKLVMRRLGLHPDHPQLRILASSASLEPGDEKSLTYISDFFGFKGIEDVKDKFEVIPGELNPIEPLSNDEKVLPIEPFIQICHSYDKAGKTIDKEEFIDACIVAGNFLKKYYDVDCNVNSLEDFLQILLHPKIKLRERFFEASSIVDKEGKKVPTPVCTFRKPGDGNPQTMPYFFESLFGHHPDEVIKKAARGILIARSIYDEPNFKKLQQKNKNTLQRFRFHYFFRNIEGLWASTETNDSQDSRTVGKLYSAPRIKSEEGHRVLELAYCDNCSTTFLGGQRGAPGEDDALCELLPVSANIEGMPEKTPAKLIEKRSYQEFGLFWPQGDQEFVPHDRSRGEWNNPTDAYWRPTTLEGENSTEYRAQWVPTYLNKYSGDVIHPNLEVDEKPENWIRGYYFKITRQDGGTDVSDFRLPRNKDEFGNLIDTHKSLPCTCPSCGVNEQYRAKGSPVRGFRTGFAKTTQIFAKELVYQLPDNVKQRKLVVFSDSREDAAQISNGIERNHFTDLLREILIRELHLNVLVNSKILDKLEKNENTEEIKQKYRNNYFEITGLLRDSKIEEDDPVETFRKRRSKAIDTIGKLKSRIIRVNELVHLLNTDECAPLVKSFIDLGVNPGGPAINRQNIPNSNLPWFDMFDFETKSWKTGNPNFQEELQNGTYVQLANLFFGNLFYSLEASGLGFLTVNPSSIYVEQNASRIGLEKTIFLEAINSSIRILGHKYKYSPTDYDSISAIDVNEYSSTLNPAQFKKYVRGVATLHSISENDLGTAILNTLTSLNALDNNGLRIPNLYIKVTEKNDPVWISARGGRPHLHKSAGVCTQYPTSTLLTNPPQGICQSFWKNNYLSYHSAFEKRKPIRLHCEELTGQTDDQFERQRHFRNIILLDDGQPLAKTIDLLSVTTTLEVGVDIGSLQAVMLANMPPQRFNYQQRVGRAGRRGQAFSAILTFCRGRSHDEFYFNNINKITGDPPPSPFLTMSQDRIVKRILAKEVLRQAFLPLTREIRLDILSLSRSERQTSVHGEFGKTNHWVNYKENVRSWIRDNKTEIEILVEAVKPGIKNEKKLELVNWLVSFDIDGLFSNVNKVIENNEIASIDISEKLAEGGILPMFGMPTSSRNLYHEIKSHGNDFGLKSIDRDTSLAIYEFAPGSQKTKDKAIHTSIGFTDDYNTVNGFKQQPIKAYGRPFYNERWMLKCNRCGTIETDQNRPEIDECPNCGAILIFPENIFPIKSPVGYRSNLTIGKDSKENSEIILSRPPILAESNEESTKEPPQIGINYKATIADRDITWRVNTNGDRFFEGKLQRTGNRIPSYNDWFNFENQWILRGVENYNESNYQFHINNGGSDFEHIALAAHKNTEVLRIRPRFVSPALTLNMFRHPTSVNNAGVRSAFYSAAFLLQRVIADKLDVDPVEIEIADIRKIVSENGEDTAEIILTDELPNGSGFVRHLFREIEPIIQEVILSQDGLSYLGNIHSNAHKKTCKDACYDCLKVFRNMSYHGLLDWRLGMSLLRSLTNRDYVAGADGKFDEFPELEGWMEDSNAILESFKESFNLDVYETSNLPVLVSKTKAHFIIIIHPLWNCSINSDGFPEVPENTWLAECIFPIFQEAQKCNGVIKFIDTFNLHRRPGWCYQKLFSN